MNRAESPYSHGLIERSICKIIANRYVSHAGDIERNYLIGTTLEFEKPHAALFCISLATRIIRHRSYPPGHYSNQVNPLDPLPGHRAVADRLEELNNMRRMAGDSLAKRYSVLKNKYRNLTEQQLREQSNVSDEDDFQRQIDLQMRVNYRIHEIETLASKIARIECDTGLSKAEKKERIARLIDKAQNERQQKKEDTNATSLKI